MRQEILTYTKEFASQAMDTIEKGAVIDKTVPGCGITSLMLENDENVIVAVPTVYLAVNKAEQYPNKRTNCKVLAVYGGTTTDDVDNFIQTNEEATKLIVTYDSLKKVAHLLDSHRLIVDEYDQLLSYTKLKPQVVDYLFDVVKQYKDTATFVTATPTPLEYMPEFVKGMKQIKMEWPNTIKTNVIEAERTYPYKALREEILSPLSNNGTLTVQGYKFDSVIVFVNSINQIVKAIKQCNLDKSECNVICGNSLKNDVKISGIKRYKTENKPKYLFVTSSGFAGIDIDMPNSMTVILSSTASDYTMLDLKTDVKQAVSRQRNKSNPNYGIYIYMYNQSLFDKTEEELQAKIDFTKQKIHIHLDFQSQVLATRGIDNVMTDDEFDAYTLIKDDKFVFNLQAYKADEYFIKEIRKQYKKGFDITAAQGATMTMEPIVMEKELSFGAVLAYYKENVDADGNIDWDIHSFRTEWIEIIEESYRLFGTCDTDKRRALKKLDTDGDVWETVKLEIKEAFSKDYKFHTAEVKEMLQEIYSKHKLDRTPSNKDLAEAGLNIECKKVRKDGENKYGVMIKR